MPNTSNSNDSNVLFPDDVEYSAPKRSSTSRSALTTSSSTSSGNLSNSDKQTGNNSDIPTMSRLCLIKVRGLKSRLEGLTQLPEDIVKSIVEGSTSDELKQVEEKNPDAVKLKYWDTFWRSVCEKTMSPSVLSTKDESMAWRDYFLQVEQQNKDKFKEAGQRARSRLNTLQTNRAGMVVLEDTPRLGSSSSSSSRSFHRSTPGSSSSSSHRPFSSSSAAIRIRPTVAASSATKPQLKLSNPAIQKARKFAALKSFPRR